MTTKGKSTQQDSILNEIVHCAFCGTNMVLDGALYVCPWKSLGTGVNCYSASVDAKRLALNLMTILVNRVLTPDTLAEIVERIQRSANDNLRNQRNRLDDTESKIEELNRRKLDILTDVEYGEVQFTEIADTLEAIEAARAGLAYESSVSQEEIDKLQFIGDQDAIQSVALDVGTYTEFADPELARQLAETFLKDIQIGDSTVTVSYTHPIPGPERGELITSETFPLQLV